MRMRLSNAVPYINDAKNTAHVTENKSIRMRSMNAVLLEWQPKRTAHVRVATAYVLQILWFETDLAMICARRNHSGRVLLCHEHGMSDKQFVYADHTALLTSNVRWNAPFLKQCVRWFWIIKLTKRCIK